ncbi:MAG TPA: DUF5309 family protein [Phycisphaerae bacterium]|nr:DUF5309 family protein [Phycisphaerae bacterium]HPS53728.1 DUF5309 family protein [Phycisphaerae bacterium]
MSFTGKATYTAGSTLPEMAEDVSDIVSIVSPYETPFLDHIGDPQRAAGSTYHEWLEDTLLPNKDVIADSSIDSSSYDTTITVAHGSRFRVGDQLRAEDSGELMLVTGVNGNDLTLIRGYGGTTSENLSNAQVIHILGNAALEGDDAPSVRFTNRIRTGNWTQIFTAAVRVSGSDLAVRKLAVADELDYQKQERLRELLRDLENTVINGAAPASDKQGSASVRRTMHGIIPSITTNVFVPGEDSFPSGALSETQLNLALRMVWENSASRVDTILVNGFQKRKINSFITSTRGYTSKEDTYRDMVSIYESDFGICRVILSRHVPADSVLLLDSSRIDVLPLAGRSFYYKPLASAGDYEAGEVIGEYTLEFRNEMAHGVISGLTTA